VSGWIDALTGAGLLQISPDTYRTLSLTEAGRDVVRGRRTSIEVVQPALSSYEPAWSRGPGGMDGRRGRRSFFNDR
jgi:hypothetical protein